ncbi:Gfo/Idh/MocA family protein [Roseiconus lacunae]|uniref:Gfo/Idh/MocA family oxidoreductase n=1 Tax=Roseiconus lacunae TaxID=2605694 RepID=A0ABT7PEK0_9BACT|nr:Gfo/Idh/MocA family oxidoreductase [Roseiconus lacunae]MCD0460011.1 Gfo/Idh/MocA family oxidoreductase [Roseiconus lacunae]MDM4014917.1 Gfo/Idh/MocA family oxidoreductase [Roseiconus lacunae]WRQ50496.1 Gfo/Idh/MocA family oxidoreductase [Stieleria sp. HD01]
MVDKLSADERTVGEENYYNAVSSYYDVNRRDFLRGIVGAGVVSGAGLGAAYFGYGEVKDPVRVAVIGTGDEGNVLIGGCNPNYVDVRAICDIRPFSQHRAFHGDCSSASALVRRPGLIRVAGYKDESEARKHVKVYDGLTTGGIMECLDDPDIEAVIIALPLWLHAPVAALAMERGLHVLTEKLMAHNVAQCKVMSRMAAELKDKKGNPIHLATGHQRHYNVKYENAVNLIRWGLLGQLHHIRAQWHRGNLPGRDSWSMPIPGGEKDENGKLFDRIAKDLDHRRRALENATSAADIERLQAEVAQWEAWDADKMLNDQLSKFGYNDFSVKFPGGKEEMFSAAEELHRWRLFQRTGAGLMAELGSHQLDAVSIFLSSLREDGKKVHPLSVHAVGGRHIMPRDREVGDHIYCTFEFPGPEYPETFDVGYHDRVEGYPNGAVPGYEQDPNKKVVVTYSTINGNGFGGWGEVVMGSKGTLVLDKEQDVLLYRNSDTSSKVGVKKDAAGSYALDTSASGDFAAPVAQAAATGPVSRGYREEIEHWAFCIRNPDPENKPRCYPEVAMGDAVIALGANQALKNAAAGKGGYLQFKEEWFDVNSDETPDGSDIAREQEAMLKDVS